MLKLTQFCKAVKAGDFLNIFLRFCDFWGLLSHKKFSSKKKLVF